MPGKATMFSAVMAGLLCALTATAGERIWTRTTGQYPVECTPVIASMGQDEVLLAVARAGEVMAWTADGKDWGAGTDGKVGQLPKGVWSSSPAVVPAGEGGGIVVCDTKGHIVCLDGAFASRWEYQLPGEVSFSCATPARIALPGTVRSGYCLSDQTGLVTCLDGTGEVVWTRALGTGECDAPVTAVDTAEGVRLLASAGAMLHLLDASGVPVWSADLKSNASSRAVVFDPGGGPRIFCGTAGGDLCVLHLDGRMAWSARIGDEVGNTIVSLPRREGGALVLCTGLWGNLHAFDAEGNRVWTHVFRSKNRGTPVVFDADGDGRMEVLLTTYSQHVLLVDDRGDLVDDMRLSGCINGSALLLPGAVPGAADVLTVDASLLSHRIRMGRPVSVYGGTEKAGDIRIAWPGQKMPERGRGVRVENPAGALLRVNVRGTGAGGEQVIAGAVGVRTAFELALPGGAPHKGGVWSCTARDISGAVVAGSDWTVPPSSAGENAPKGLAAWATPAYGLFDASCLVPCEDEGTDMRLGSIYGGEVEHGACVLANAMETPCRVHLTLGSLKDASGKDFSGTVALYEVVPTGTVNGERAYDALVDLGDARVVTVPAKASAKCWLRVDARDAEPGTYTGKLTAEPLLRESAAVELGIELRILPLELPRPLVMSACTWDYVPNTWFSGRTSDVIEDMQRHGVNIFPRTGSIPRGTVDAAGTLTMDYGTLDVDLKRYEGRGTILFQLTEPPLTFAMNPEASEKRAKQVQYLLEWRDYLKSRGRGYGDYAFYPVDEPGLGYGGNNVQLLIDSATLFREADPNFGSTPIPYQDFPALTLSDLNRSLTFGVPTCDSPRGHSVVIRAWNAF